MNIIEALRCAKTIMVSAHRDGKTVTVTALSDQQIELVVQKSSLPEALQEDGRYRRSRTGWMRVTRIDGPEATALLQALLSDVSEN